MAGADPRPGSNPSAAASAPEVTRRSFLSQGVTALAGVSAVAAAISPLRHLDPQDIPSLEQFLQAHYKEMTPEDKQRVFAASGKRSSSAIMSSRR